MLNSAFTTQSMCSNSGADKLNGTVGITRHKSKFFPRSQFPFTLTWL